MWLSNSRERASYLRVRNRITISSKGSRAKTLALLCLMAHALFVCFTHFHDSGRNAQPLSTASVRANTNSDSDHAPDSGGDSHCLSCRLQRSFVSDTHEAPVLAEAIKQALSRASLLSVPDSRDSRLVLSTRAPPLA
jgi:hypothetical protein